jgi:hypothetical protein
VDLDEVLGHVVAVAQPVQRAGDRRARSRPFHKLFTAG